ncbi:MAG: sugar phosphate isomerase/epimerase [Clostridia bacterium]|nr:sugar phosphate isomerase/epimerase [Clostridia bacterium]
MVGIYDCFGYGSGYDVSFQERYRLIKETGFDSVMLWWSDRFGRGEGYREDARLARGADLIIENIHTPVHEQNFISDDTLAGTSVFETYLQCVKDCREFEVPTMVIHAPDDKYPISELGLKRLHSIVSLAEKHSICVAFENLNNIHNLDLILESIQSPNAGFCYDSCHHANYAPGCDLLSKYRNRLSALHLHDNGGKRNQHQLPFDGHIDWADVMLKISSTSYQDSITLEPMNWDYESLSILEYLALAHQRALKLVGLLNNQ